MVREACLWDTLATGSPERSDAWWQYKSNFLQSCNSTKLPDADMDPEACSEQVRPLASLIERSDAA